MNNPTVDLLTEDLIFDTPTQAEQHWLTNTDRSPSAYQLRSGKIVRFRLSKPRELTAILTSPYVNDRDSAWTKRLRSGFAGLVVALALFVTGLKAEDKVFITLHGADYHTRANCLALSHVDPENLYTTTKEQAEAHGLKPCPICRRAASGKKTRRDNSWVEGKKTEGKKQ